MSKIEKQGDTMSAQTEIEPIDHLYQLASEVATEEKFSLAEVEVAQKNAYVEIEEEDGDRCVDGRKPKKNQVASYKGAQFAGGTLGVIDTLRAITDIDEDKAREMVLVAHNDLDWTIGDHQGEHDGKVACGNQQMAIEHKLPCISKLGHTVELIRERIQWIIEKGGVAPELDGVHEEQHALLNLNSGVTFDTENAQTPCFNFDMGAAYKLGKALFTQVQNAGVGKEMTEEGFADLFVKEMIRNYIQTLKALGWKGTILEVNR